MANRNRYARVRKNKLNSRVLSSTILPNIPLSSSDIYLHTKVGDRLDLLANQYYGDVTMWWIIAKANHLGKGTLQIKPGTKIRIPKDLKGIYAILERKNIKG